MDKLLIGEILKPQGIRGEVKMKNYTDSYSSIKDLKEVFIDDQSYQVLKIRNDDKGVFVFLKGVYDRNNAELLRGKEVFAFKKDIKKDENKHFICDVIGCKIVFDDGEVFGEVVDILSARTDIYYVKTSDGMAIVPWLNKSYNPHFNIENKEISVDKEGFLKEVSYEN